MFWILITITIICITICYVEKKKRLAILTKYKNKTLTTLDTANLPKRTRKALDKAQRLETLNLITSISESEHRLNKRTDEEHENTMKFVDEELIKMVAENEQE